MIKNMLEGKEWAQEFFTELYWELFMKRSQEQITKEAALIASLVDNNSIESILDMCCGVGDIAERLQQIYNVPTVGVEWSKDYVRKKFLNHIIYGDACTVELNRTFSLVLNWNSSFSYFNSEKNKQLLKNCYNACSGTFLLEIFNPYAVLKNFSPLIVYNKFYKNEPILIKRYSSIDAINRFLQQKWVFEYSTNGQIISEHNTQIYLYFPDEVKAILENIGFKNVQLMGRKEENCVSLDIDTPRLIIKAHV